MSEAQPDTSEPLIKAQITYGIYKIESNEKVKPRYTAKKRGFMLNDVAPISANVSIFFYRIFRFA